MVREVVPVLGGEPAAQLVPGRSGGRTGCRARPCAGSRSCGEPSRPDALADLAVERDHDLGREQAVVARSGPARDRRCCSQEVVRPDRRPGHPEATCSE